MSPIEEHLEQRLARELAAAGVQGFQIAVLSAEAENWRYRVSAAGRSFEIGFNHRDRFWCRETTVGGEKHFVSNDHAPIHCADTARRLAVRLLRHALTHPHFAPRDPPII